jgi:tripartite-type tricarboxylate transporter receptor subunit TctC
MPSTRLYDDALKRLAAIALLATSAMVAAIALGAPPAAAYPDRPVTFLVPYAPGGGTDVYARLLAEGLQQQLKQSFVVENRAGAATQIAASALINAPADGYTIMMAAGTTLAVNPMLYKRLSYNVDELAPVALVGHSYFVLLANPSVPAKNLQELIAYIKSQPPGSLSYGTPGSGTPHHLFMEMLLSRIGAKMTQVPYRGSTPALTDVVAGNIPMMIVDLTPAQQLIGAGKVRAFGITSPERAKPAPDIPTIEEAGLPGYAGVAWNAVVAKKGTSPTVIQFLNKTISDYIKRPEITQKVYLNGIQPVTSTVEEFEKFIIDERTKWSKVIADAGIPKVD